MSDIIEEVDSNSSPTAAAELLGGGIQPNVFEAAMMRGAEDGTLALSQLAEFEELFSRVNGDQSALIHNILKQDRNLSETLAETEKRQETIFDSFIEQHVEQIPLLCAMFDEITKCESKLLEFESSIATFQERLTTTADGIGRMQQETVQLRTRVKNRQEVSDRLKQVYEALHETERFCETIANAAAVDEQFLLSIRQLESKIAFLADNEELGGSAIEGEMRPRLVAAAQKAGNKLHEFLVRRLASLTAENANIQLHQQAIERSGQYAFSFLAKYNPAIADEITSYYTQIMTDVYTRITRSAVKNYEDTLLKPDSSGGAAQAQQRRAAFEPFATAELVNALSSNGQRFVDPRNLPLVNRVIDTETSVTTRFESSSTSSSVGDPASVAGQQPKREKSIGDSIRGFFSRNAASDATAAGAAQAAKQRPAVFADFVHVLQGLDINSTTRSMSFDPLVAQMLSKSSCWAYSLTSILVKLVNSVVSEGRFLDNFFFFVSAGAATEREESMLRSIFEPSLAMTLDLVRNQAAVCNDPIALLTMHRVAELCKNFLTQCCNPSPIMLLTVPLDHIFLALGHRLSIDLMDTHLENLRAFASCAPFRKFSVPPPDPQQVQQDGGGGSSGRAPLPLAPVGGSARFVDLVQTDRQLAALLGPNDVVRRFASGGGQLACINGLKLEGSRVCASSLLESERVVYDDTTSDKLMALVSLMANIVDGTSSAHTTALAKAICKVNSFGHIYSSWKHMEPPAVQPQIQSAPASSSSTKDDKMMMIKKSGSSMEDATNNDSPSAQQQHHHHHRQHHHPKIQLIPDKDRTLVESTSSYTLVSRECRLLDEVLRLSISEFVSIDVQTIEIFAPFVALVDKYPVHVATASAGSPAPRHASDATANATATAPPCSEQELLAVLVPFHKGWLDALTAVVQRLRVYFSEHEGPYQLVIKEYFAFLVDKVKKMHSLVTRFYPKSTTVKSKTVGPATFVSELKRMNESRD